MESAGVGGPVESLPDAVKASPGQAVATMGRESMLADRWPDSDLAHCKLTESLGPAHSGLATLTFSPGRATPLHRHARREALSVVLDGCTA